MAAECRWCYHNILSLFASVFADPKDFVLEGHVCIRFYHKCKIIMLLMRQVFRLSRVGGILRVDAFVVTLPSSLQFRAVVK